MKKFSTLEYGIIIGLGYFFYLMVYILPLLIVIAVCMNLFYKK